MERQTEAGSVGVGSVGVCRWGKGYRKMEGSAAAREDEKKTISSPRNREALSPPFSRTIY